MCEAQTNFSVQFFSENWSLWGFSSAVWLFACHYPSGSDTWYQQQSLKMWSGYGCCGSVPLSFITITRPRNKVEFYAMLMIIHFFFFHLFSLLLSTLLLFSSPFISQTSIRSSRARLSYACTWWLSRSSLPNHAHLLEEGSRWQTLFWVVEKLARGFLCLGCIRGI